LLLQTPTAKTENRKPKPTHNIVARKSLITFFLTAIEATRPQDNKRRQEGGRRRRSMRQIKVPCSRNSPRRAVFSLWIVATTCCCIIVIAGSRMIIPVSALLLPRFSTLATIRASSTRRILTTAPSAAAAAAGGVGGGGLIESYNGVGVSRTEEKNQNEKNKNQHQQYRGIIESSSSSSSTTTTTTTVTTTTGGNITNNRDILISRAAKLRQCIVKQQVELLEIQQTIECCAMDGSSFFPYYNGDGTTSGKTNGISSSSNNNNNNNLNNIGAMVDTTLRKFAASSLVLRRKLDRVKDRVGPNNKQWNSVSDYVLHELEAGLRIVSAIVRRPEQLQQLIDPSTPTLMPHVPAILARLDKLEVHVSPILERVLNNRQHLASIEPYLDEVLERFDDIEPHLAWILDNVDALAPYTGLLLKHIDALLLYSEVDEIERSSYDDNDKDKDNKKDKKDKDYSLANQLLPYLEYYVSKLDVVGPHLVYLRPHVPLLLKHNRIARVSPHIDKLFARGYNNLGASANLDILLFWFGWSLRIPGLPRLFFALPFSPRLVAFLANRLPKKFARRGKNYCRNMECSIDENYGVSWNKLESKSSSVR
jgi:hypothetical protein